MRYHRKVIHISALDSPNVQRALLEQNRGLPASNTLILAGVLTWEEYAARRATWDTVRQCIGLDGRFYEGAEALLFPPEWLNRAERIAATLAGKPRRAKAIGCDPGEGGADTAWCVIDELGIVELLSLKTPDTSIIPNTTVALLKKWNVPAGKVVFDRGGGGKQHADRLRDNGYDVRTVAFGEQLQLEPRCGLHQLEVRLDIKEEGYSYTNRRAQMYDDLSKLLDPVNKGWGIPARIMGCRTNPQSELRHQLAPIPRTYDDEGRMYVLPKQRKVADPPGVSSKAKLKTLVEIIGHSPDEADALVLAVHGMLHDKRRSMAGGF